MNITVIGTGFVGVVTAAVYASFGHSVIGLDIDKNKVSALQQSKVPFFEPNLEALLQEQQQLGRLHFTTDYQEAIAQAEIIFIAVGTPSAADGQADLTYVFASIEALAPYLKERSIVVVKSTVPPGTLEKVAAKIRQHTTVEHYLASVPEFLREGSAVHDTLHPDRVVIGATSEAAFEKLELLHKPLQAPILKVKPESAQMAKYSANAYLATRITFINQIADLCEKNGADIQEVINIIGQDKRIGQHYWYPGLGYGGSCFPKDVKELAAYSRSVNEAGNLFNKINELNEERLQKLLSNYETLVGGWNGKQVAILGLSFKPNTDDMREAPSTKIIPYLLEKGAKVKAFDPMASWSMFQNRWPINQVESIESATKAADVIMALVEWPEIISFDFGQVKESQVQWFIDARNQFTGDQLAKAGYNYRGIGR